MIGNRYNNEGFDHYKPNIIRSVKRTILYIFFLLFLVICSCHHYYPTGWVYVHNDYDSLNQGFQYVEYQDCPKLSKEIKSLMKGMVFIEGGVFNMEEPFIHPQSGNQVVASRAWSYEPSTQGAIVQTVWEERDGGGRLIRRLVRDPIRLHCVFRFEMEHLLDRAGYTIEAVFGDFFKRPLLDDSPSMVWLAKRA